MNSYITVSIVIPVYNVAPYIADCLRSVLAQTYSLLEVILVNDATPDDSMTQAAPWIEKLQARFEVKVLNHTSNRGLSAARNTGMEAATGDWIYFLDSDDEITPNCIELLVAKAAEHPDVDFVIGGVKVVGARQQYPLKCLPYVDSNKEIVRDYVQGKWYVMAWNRLLKKEYILKNNLSFREGILHEDLLYSFQIATTACSMAAVNQETYIYKIRNIGSISSQKRLKNFEDMFLIIKLKYNYISKIKYQSEVCDLLYAYSFACINTFTISLVSEKSCVKLGDKIRLLSELRNGFRDLQTHRTKHLECKYEMLMYFYKLPICLILVSAKLYVIIQSILSKHSI